MSGIHADGGHALWRLWAYGSGAVHDLIAGTTGSGKSRFLEQLLAEARHSGLVVTWLIDPQGGQSLPVWMDRVDWSVRSTDEGLEVLRTAHEVMLARSKYLANLRWTDDKGRARRGQDSFTPTKSMPLLWIVVEESPELFADHPKEAARLVESIGKMGRKCGLKLTLVSQVPSVEQLGGSSTIRSMVSSGNIACFRTSDRVSGGMAFAGSMPGDPSKLPRELPDGSSSAGLGYISGSGTRSAIMRAYYVDDVVEWATTGTPATLDKISVQAAGDAYANREPSADVADAPESRHEPREQRSTLRLIDTTPDSEEPPVPKDDQATDVSTSLLAAAEPDAEDLVDEATELVVRSQFVSLSMLQRKLRIGYATAGRVLDDLERNGIVGPSTDGSPQRSVLVDVDELDGGATTEPADLTATDHPDDESEETPDEDEDETAVPAALDLEPGLTASDVIERVVNARGEVRTYEVVKECSALPQPEYRYSPRAVAAALKDLSHTGRIERAGRCVYRAAERMESLS